MSHKSHWQSTDMICSSSSIENRRLHRMQNNDNPRILIVGSSGNGKSTFAAALSQSLHIPHIELDALNWETGFVPSPEFLPRLQSAVTTSPGWIVDGNFRRAQDLVETLITHVIWLDLPLYISLYWLFKRTFWRWWSGKLLWGKCRETMTTVFAWGDAGLFYCKVKYFSKRRTQLLEKTRELAKNGKIVWRLRSKTEIEDFLRRIKRDGI